MDIKQKILHLYRVNEKSLREISRELGIDRKTLYNKLKLYGVEWQLWKNSTIVGPIPHFFYSGEIGRDFLFCWFIMFYINFDVFGTEFVP